MRKTIAAALVAIICLAGCSNHSPRTIEDFNFDWKFALGDAPEYAQPSFDDGSWRSLHLPHDWSIEGNFSKDNPSTPGGGALPGGIGWYRKHFKSPEAGRRVFVEFDGVFMNSTVYVGGKEMGTRPYGYSSFTYDITDALAAPGEDNLIAVRCDNSDQPNSRWYAGCGIYRNVRLVTVDPVHVAYSGVFVTTPEVSAESATVSVAVEVEAPEGAQYAVSNTILDARGHKVAEGTTELKVARPQLWDVDHPYLYTLVTRVESEGRLADEYRTRLGIRSFSYDIDHGFELNGRPLRMLGVCLHHDMGCLGTAVHRRALERELTIMREMGVNAIRTSHNPPAPELLELCDEMGLMVMDEAFDMWRKRKTEFDYARFFDEWHERDLVDFLKRDRNHPCIVMWSVGNEILEQWNSDEDDLKNLTAEQANLMMNFLSKLPHKDASDDNPNIRLTRHMVEIVKSLDTTRPVSSGCNETQPYNNLLKSGALDVYGFNYHLWDYDSCRVWYPNKPLYGSETVSSLNSRGVYFQPSTEEVSLPAHWWEIYESEHHQCTAYDACHAPWSNTHEDSWIAIRDREYMFGTFIWTGFDYLGEPTPYTWPSRSSYFGIVDLAGFPKDPYWMYMAEWTDKTVLHLFPHWNWKPGDKIDVWAYYNNADEVELFLNGRSLGRQSKTAEVLHCNWQQVDWEPGEIIAVSYKDGVEVARESRRTTGEPVGLRLTPDRPVIAADGYDLSYVTVEAIDAEGLAVPTADGMLRFEVSGAGELFGIDNGNAADTLSLKGCEKALFSGKALAVVRSLRGERGTAELTVSGYGVEVTCGIRVK
ncbi:MAG: DUF4982 domain-containing protein [Bacteroidales bacterium]|nr:DUF4982 domain-containing protein [Bacteroidales bacterium]